jgi:hypothetical protein
MELVRGRISKQKTVLGFGDLFTPEQLKAIQDSPFSIIPTDTVEQANVLAIAQTAPAKEPARSEYSSNIDYLKAKAKWIVAQQLKPKSEGV